VGNIEEIELPYQHDFLTSQYLLKAAKR